MEQNKKSWSTRDWIFISIIIFMVQAAVWFLSYHFGTNDSALSYISFAGTLVSIILAVLAIGYTYVESQQQKNSSSALTNQITSLDNIRDKLAIQADALEDMKLVKDSMMNYSNMIDSHFKENIQRMENLNNNVSYIAKNISQQTKNNTGSGNFYESAKNFNNTLNYLYFAIAGLFFEKEFKKIDHFTFDELQEVFNEINLDYAALQVTRDYIYASCTVTINNLLFNDAVNYSNNYINPELIDLIKFSAEKIKNAEDSSYNQNQLSLIGDRVLQSDLFNGF
ncbi:MAG: hypothetical protein ACN6NS_08220 [Acinetobacter johnsonii]